MVLSKIRCACLSFHTLGAVAVLAAVSWTDQVFAQGSVKIEQIRNGSSANPVSPPNWVTGNAGQSNSHFFEGNSMAYRAIVSGLNINLPSHYITIEYDIRTGGKHALDYITNYNRLEPHLLIFNHPAEIIDPLAPSSNLPAGNYVLGPPALIPTPPDLIGNQPSASFNSLPQSEREMTIYNGTITNIEFVPSGDVDKARMKITFVAGSSTVIIAWGGHIASQADWGQGNSAPFINGSSYHMRMNDFSGGSVGSQDLSLMTSAVTLTPPTCDEITGSDLVCPGSTNEYCGPEAPQGETYTYQWSLTSTCGASFVGGNQSPTTRCVQVVACTACDSTYQLTLQVTANGLNTVCNKTVAVQDNTPPTITCPSDTNAQCVLPAPNPASVTTSDTCGGTVTVTWIGDVLTSAPGVCPKVYARTYRATDNCDNIAECTQTITVVDTTPPSLTCPASTAVQCVLPAPNPASVIATDNCDDTVNVVWVGDVLTSQPGACPRVYTRTYSATDSCNNTGTCTQTITVQDTVAPVLSGCPGNLNIACTSQIPAPANVTALDNCDGPVTVSFNESSVGSGCGAQARVITRTWSAVDSCGNPASCTQTITVQDNVPPVLNGCPSPVPIIISCPSQIPPVPNVTANDNCAGAIEPVLVITDVGSGCPNSPRVITRTWTATDPCGNASSCQQVITLIDANQPTMIGCPDNITAQCLDPIPDPPTVTAIDSCGGNAPVTFTQTDVGTGCPDDPRIITRTWTATGTCNTNSCTQIITLIDTLAPTISCPPDADIQCGEDEIPPVITNLAELIQQGGSAQDNCSDVTIELTNTTQSPAGVCPVVITRTYRAVDACGNASESCTQTLRLIDDSPPVICCAQDIVGCVGFPVDLRAPEVTDECGMTITPVCTRSDNLSCSDPFPVGVTTVTWMATDGCGNQSEPYVMTVTINDCPTFNTKTQNGWRNSGGGEDGSLIHTLLSAPYGNLVIGRKNITDPRALTIKSAAADCIASRLPASGTPGALPNFGKQVLQAGSCNTDPALPLTNSGKFKNPLIGQTIALTLNIRNDKLSGGGQLGALELCPVMTTLKSNGTVKSYTIPASVLNALGNNRTVNNLRNLANKALSGQSVTPTTPSAINTALARVNSMFSDSSNVALLSTSCSVGRSMLLAGDDESKHGFGIEDDGDELSAGQTRLASGSASGDRRSTDVANATVNSGLLTPAIANGLIEVEGDLVQTVEGSMLFQLRGYEPQTGYDVIMVNGQVFLEGALIVELAEGFVPNVGDQFEIMVAEGLAGEFDVLDLADVEGLPYLHVTYTPQSVVVEVMQLAINGDLDANGMVNANDLMALLNAWGQADATADLNADGTVDVADLTMLLSNWGQHLTP